MSIILFALMLSVGNAGTLDFVSDRCMAVVTARGAARDVGLSWLVDSWAHTPPEVPIRKLVADIEPDEVSLAIFPSGKMLVVLGAWKGKPKTRDLEALIPGALGVVRYKEMEITFSTGEGAFSAYSLCRGNLLIGTDRKLIEEAADAREGRSVEHLRSYSEMEGNLVQEGDIIFFADNRNQKFAEFLRALEDKWKMSLLLSADRLEWVGACVDVVDQDRVKGRVVFKSSDGRYIEDVRDDADFLGETFKRKFIAEGVVYSGHVDVKGEVVVLRFEAERLEPLWRKLFERGVLSLIRP
ncbi:MAG: hypothetical protein DRQ08_00835 [Candidatus Latescibacterota bacterium]|nr:MAG: hypothetical protein DRQ08_00835 [Candidatus Latescibacterota bacterium]